MSREEDLIRSTTHALASTVRDVPPLRLEAATEEPRSPVRRRLRGDRTPPRRWWSWAAPVTAAACVVALAVALVLIRDIPNGRAEPGNVSPEARSVVVAPTAYSSSVTSPASGPDGIPRYYVAVQRAVSKPTGKKPPAITTPLVVGDSLTGAKLATVTPPAGVSFESVAAADDDRTFVVAGQVGHGSPAVDELFEMHLAPGSAHPVRFTALPVKAQTSLAVNYGTFAIALSASATELAVAEFPGPDVMAVKVFSVATGTLLHEWSTVNPSLSVSGLSEAPTLTWIDDDRALALATLGTATRAGKNDYVAWQTVRRLGVDEPAGVDLIAGSTVLRHVQVGGNFGTGSACGYMLQWPPVISADGKTFTCTTGAAFVTYPLRAGTTGAGPGRTDLTTAKNEFVSSVLWSSASGGTLIAEWGVTQYGTIQSNGEGVQVYAISHGTPTRLRFPPGFSPAFAGDIAW